MCYANPLKDAVERRWGGAKFGGGGGRKWRFSPGGSLPLGHLSVTSNRDSSLATQRSVHSAIHERVVAQTGTRPSGASFPAVVVIRNQYPTLIGPARVGGVEHSEDFMADRHPRTAEGRPKA
jgi:hypothetical protein